jgi:hypothetical protein
MPYTRISLASLALLLSTQAIAADAPLVSATGSVGEITYKLVDLDPNDGVTAAVTFGNAAQLQLYVSDGIANNAGQPAGTIEQKAASLSGAPFSSALSGSVALSDGRVQLDSNQGRLSGLASYDAAYVNGFLASVPAGAFGEHYASAFAPMQISFTLTPKTRIEFSANVDLSALVDVTALQAYHTNLSAQASSSVFASISGVAATGDITLSSPLLTRSVTVNADGSVAQDRTSDASFNKDLFLSWTNTSSKNAGTNLGVSLSVGTIIITSPQLAVPEVGSQWLFTLGLVGLAGAVARRRAAMRHAD